MLPGSVCIGVHMIILPQSRALTKMCGQVCIPGGLDLLEHADLAVTFFVSPADVSDIVDAFEAEGFVEVVRRNVVATHFVGRVACRFPR